MKILKMRSSMVFSVFVVTVFGIPTTKLEDDNSPIIQQLFVETAPGVYGNEDLTGPIPNYEAKEEDVKFYFASRDNLTRIQVDARDAKSISETSFSLDKDTWFIVHGWLDNVFGHLGETVGNALLQKADVNIFFVDWSSIARKTYLEAFAAVPDIGRITGELIQVLITDHGLQLEKVHLVGHSIGAHIAGRIGAALDGKIPLIVATKLEDDNSPIIQQLFVETAPGVYGNEDLTGPIPNYEAKEEDVKFYFASRDNLTRIQVDARDAKSISETSFSLDKDTWFIVHGWLDNVFGHLGETVGNALLQKADVNIFFVDWSSIARKTYLEAFAAVPDIGRITGELIQVLITDHGLQLEKVHLVGHSIGAHIAGRIGAALDGKIPLIVGLDPAGPLFFYEVTNNRLDSTDAQFVHVIHTCAALLGFRKPLGHADYYPNGGEFQPACSLDITGSCSHSLSYTYFVESLITGNFLAKSCPSKDDFNNGKCNNNVASEMGGYSPDREASGTYYLKTNKSPPYAMG